MKTTTEPTIEEVHAKIRELGETRDGLRRQADTLDRRLYELVLVARERGTSLRAIGELLGVTRSAVHQWMTRNEKTNGV